MTSCSIIVTVWDIKINVADILDRRLQSQIIISLPQKYLEEKYGKNSENCGTNCAEFFFLITSHELNLPVITLAFIAVNVINLVFRFVPVRFPLVTIRKQRECASFLLGIEDFDNEICLVSVTQRDLHTSVKLRRSDILWKWLVC